MDILGVWGRTESGRGSRGVKGVGRMSEGSPEVPWITGRSELGSGEGEWFRRVFRIGAEQGAGGGVRVRVRVYRSWGPREGGPLDLTETLGRPSDPRGDVLRP